MRINYNVSAMISNNALSNSENLLTKSLERLSSGLKINHAKDNPAGLATAKRMNAQLTGLSKAKENANDGISVIETADGAMTEVHEMLQRLNELAVKSANGTLSDDDRTMIQQEAEQLCSEIDRISDTVEFDTQKLLNGEFDLKAYTTEETMKVSTYSDKVAKGQYELKNVAITLDADGNVLDADGNVVVKAEDITAYVEQSGNVTDEKAEEPKVDDAQKTEDKTDAKDEVKANDKKTETKVDESKKDEQKPADNKQDTSKTDTKTGTKTDNKSDNKSDTKTETPSQKPSTPSYDNGSLTTAQVKELQRWYGVTADGQWGAGSKKAAGGRTADEAWAYYQNNKQTTTPDQPSGGNTGNTGNNGGSTTPSKPSDDNSGSTGGGSTTPTEPTKPTKPTKADIDCAAAMSVGNSYAEGYGFTVDSACRSYFPPIYLERDCPESCWNQEWVESAIKQKVDYVKSALERNGEWYPEIEGWYVGINCVVRWNASAGYHEIFVYYGG